MNWGKGIILTLIAFGTIILSMVAICVKQDDIHLVTQNYYEEEIKYQEQIDKISNASHLGYEALKFDSLQKELHVQLPVGAKGTLHLFRPSDARLDQKINFDISSEDGNVVKLSQLKPGYWKVKMTWEEKGMAYYSEEKINL